MKAKKLLFGSMVVGTSLAVTRLLFAKPSSTKPASSGTSYDDIDDYIERQMRRLNMPGASLAIVEGDQIAYQRGYGRTRPGGEAPTSQTPFFIGSLTKSFTALAIMQLVEVGKVALDTPVQYYLPWFRVADPKASAQMTVRHLLNQTSGLPMLAGMINLANFDDRPDATEQQIRSLSTLVLDRPVGSVFEYSNLNYNVLGLIIEIASGESYTDYIHNHIFNPLSMGHSTASKEVAKLNGLAMGHRYWFGKPIPAPDFPVPRGSLPSGQLISSAEDLARYMITQLNGGQYGGAQILSAAGVDEMHRGVAGIKELGASCGHYGMGWISQEIGGVRIISHSGIVPDFGAFMALLPQQNKGIVLLFNAHHAALKVTMDRVGIDIAQLLAGQRPSPTRVSVALWMMRAFLLIPILQIADVSATLRRIRSWRLDMALCPSRGSLWGKHILPSLIPNLSLTAILVSLRSSGLLCFMRLFMPDLSWITIICGGFSVMWALIRTGLILTNRRKNPTI